MNAAKQDVVCRLRRCGSDDVITVTDNRVLIGSHRHCDVTIKSATIAPVNCQLVFESDSWVVRNLADISQTKVNGQDVIEATLVAGDVLWLGTSHKYVVEFPADETDRAEPSQTDETQAACLMLRKGHRWCEPVELRPRHTIGRGKSNSTSLPDDAQCSREHCEIVQDGDRWVIRDLGSRHGTRVNGELTESSVALTNNDLISVGTSQFMFRLSQDNGDDTCYGLDDTA